MAVGWVLYVKKINLQSYTVQLYLYHDSTHSRLVINGRATVFSTRAVGLSRGPCFRYGRPCTSGILWILSGYHYTGTGNYLQ